MQTCIVHLIRQSLRYVPRRQYDAVVKDLKPIYTAIDADAALAALESFEEKWGAQLPVIGRAWRDAWDYVIPFLAFEPEVRRVIYTTDENVKGFDSSGAWEFRGAIGRGGSSEGRRWRLWGSVRSRIRSIGAIRACGGLADDAARWRPRLSGG